MIKGLGSRASEESLGEPRVCNTGTRPRWDVVFPAHKKQQQQQQNFL